MGCGCGIGEEREEEESRGGELMMALLLFVHRMPARRRPTRRVIWSDRIPSRGRLIWSDRQPFPLPVARRVQTATRAIPTIATRRATRRGPRWSDGVPFRVSRARHNFEEFEEEEEEGGWSDDEYVEYDEIPVAIPVAAVVSVEETTPDAAGPARFDLGYPVDDRRQPTVDNHLEGLVPWLRIERRSPQATMFPSETPFRPYVHWGLPTTVGSYRDNVDVDSDDEL